MADAPDVHGPIDFLVLEFDPDKADGSAAAALLDLVDRGIIHVYDLLVIRKDADGSVSGIDINDAGFSAFAGVQTGLLGDDDVSEAGGVLEDGRAAALIVYENTWAIPFVAAAQSAGAEVVASGRIPATEVMAALDELESADAAG